MAPLRIPITQAKELKVSLQSFLTLFSFTCVCYLYGWQTTHIFVVLLEVY